MNRLCGFKLSLIGVSLSSLYPSYGVLAAESLTPVLVSGFSWMYFVKLGIALAAVLVFFILFAWAMKRYQRIGTAENGGLSVIANLPLGTRERLVVVQAGDTQVLLGITSTQISQLTVLDSPLKVDTEKDPLSFRSNFERMIAKKSE